MRALSWEVVVLLLVLDSLCHAGFVKLKSRISVVDRLKYTPRQLKGLTSSSLESLLLKLTVPSEDVINENLMFQLFRISQTPVKRNKEADSTIVQDTISRKLSSKAKEEDWRIAAKSLYIIHRLINSDVDSKHSVAPDIHFNYGNYPSSGGQSSASKLFSSRFIGHLDGIIYVIRMRISCLEQLSAGKATKAEDVRRINQWRWALRYAQYLTFLSQITDVSRAHVPKDSISGSHNNKYSYLHDLMLLKGPLRVLQFFEGVFAAAQASAEATAQMLMAPTSFQPPLCEASSGAVVTADPSPNTGTGKSGSGSTGRVSMVPPAYYDYEVLVSMYANELIDTDIQRCLHQLSSLQPRALYGPRTSVLPVQPRQASLATGADAINAVRPTIGEPAAFRGSEAVQLRKPSEERKTSTYRLQVKMEQQALNELQRLAHKLVACFLARESIMRGMKVSLLFGQGPLVQEQEGPGSSTKGSNDSSSGSNADRSNGDDATDAMNSAEEAEERAHRRAALNIPEWVHSLTRMTSQPRDQHSWAA